MLRLRNLINPWVSMKVTVTKAVFNSGRYMTYIVLIGCELLKTNHYKTNQASKPCPIHKRIIDMHSSSSKSSQQTVSGGG